jgi:hypothetical protein
VAQTITLSRADLVLRSRAISDKLVNFNGISRYMEFDRGDWAAFSAAHTHPEPWHKGLVSRSGGYVINRWGLGGNRLQPYIRFDDKVWVFTKSGRKLTRYVYPGKTALGGSSAKQIDVHPLARGHVASGGEPIYFCLEGCLKADALLSKGKVAISVPSVTLWNLAPNDLTKWLPVLLAAPVVYAVADSDYFPKRTGYRPGTKPKFVNEAQVRYHVDSCVAHYRALGVRMVFLIPPYFDRAQARRYGFDRKERWKVGIDDHLRAGGNLNPWHEKDNPRGVHIWEYRRPPYLRVPELKRKRKDRAIVRDKAFLTWLLENHGQIGLFRPQDARRALGWSRDTVNRARSSCEERGVLKTWLGKADRLQSGYSNRPHLFRVIDFGGEAKSRRVWGESLRKIFFARAAQVQALARDCVVPVKCVAMEEVANETHGVSVDGEGLFRGRSEIGRGACA